MGFVDLHTHSDASDGSFTPAHLVHLAKECISSSVFPKNRKEKFPILGMGYSHISAGNIFI